MLLPGETESLIEVIKYVSDPKVMLEIGCHLGKTSNAVLQALPLLEKYYGVEIAYGYEPSLKSQQGETPKEPGKYAKHDPRFHLLLFKGGSRDLPLHLHEIGEVDVVFIDGDHSGEAIRFDTVLCRSMVRKGGIIIWHDYGNPDARVTEVLNSEMHAHHVISHVPNTWLAYECV